MFALSDHDPTKVRQMEIDEDDLMNCRSIADQLQHVVIRIFDKLGVHHGIFMLYVRYILA